MDADKQDRASGREARGLEALRSRLGGIAPSRLDDGLRIAVYVLAVLLAVLAVVFVGTVINDRRAESEATPASRTLKELRGLVRATPNDAELRVRYGEALAAAGILDEAVEQLNQALKANPDHTGALIDLGRLAMQQGEYGTAEGYFQKVVDLTSSGQYTGIDERRELALFHLGEIALTQKRYEDAVPFFKEALRIRKDAADTYLELALAYRGMGRDEMALEQLEIAVAFDPGMAQAQYELGDIYLDAGSELKAAEHFGLAYALAPDNQIAADAVDSLGPVERRMAAARKALDAGDVETAVSESQFAALLDPEGFDGALLYAQALEASRDTSAAVAAYKDAAKIEPENPAVTDALARLGAK
ncbi:MAG: tetratricopeptide repeat protein [Actinobacteria bacterium]|nr:MAG: tetratricopeptide repeat protein [Actinomycetota bacterium]